MEKIKLKKKKTKNSNADTPRKMNLEQSRDPLVYLASKG